MATAYLQKHKQKHPHELSRQLIHQSRQHNVQHDYNGDRAVMNGHDRPNIRQWETRIAHQERGYHIGRSVPQGSKELVKDLYAKSPEQHPRTPANFIHHASSAVYTPINYMPLPACLQTMSRK